MRKISPPRDDEETEPIPSSKEFERAKRTWTDDGDILLDPVSD